MFAFCRLACGIVPAASALLVACEVRGRIETPLASPLPTKTGGLVAGPGVPGSPTLPQNAPSMGNPNEPPPPPPDTTEQSGNPPVVASPDATSNPEPEPSPTTSAPEALPSPSPEPPAAPTNEPTAEELARKRTECESRAGYQFRGGRCVTPEEMAQVVCEEQLDTAWVRGSCKKLTPARTLADFLGVWKSGNVTILTPSHPTTAQNSNVVLQKSADGSRFAVVIEAFDTMAFLVSGKFSQRLENLEVASDGTVNQHCKSLTGADSSLPVGTLAERALVIHSKYVRRWGANCEVAHAPNGAFVELRGGLEGSMSLKAAADNGHRFVTTVSR